MVYTFNPTVDPRWPEFLLRQPNASIFHTKGWLEALKATYGYEPIAFTTTKPGDPLSNAVVFSIVNSWLTGSRLVSVPFSDHCQPLAEGPELGELLKYLSEHMRRRYKYVELRPRTGLQGEREERFRNASSFTLHAIDLRPSAEAIYRQFHDSCIRRKIKRAERESLTYEAGRSEELLLKFFHLMVLTRRRHKLPPQPAEWFSNLAKYLGDAMTVHLLSKDADPIASMITLSWGRDLVYKYGCSDAKFHNLGGMPWLFWKVIQQAKELHFEELDLGRSGEEDPGLTAFKGHLGGVATSLRYLRCPASRPERRSASHQWAREALAKLPTHLLTGAGRLLYRHIG